MMMLFHINCNWPNFSASTIDLSFNSTGVLVRSWLFCFKNLPCSVGFQCMLGVDVKI